MVELNRFYINGRWQEAENCPSLDVINPATEQSVGAVPLGQQEHVSAAVSAAQDAWQDFSNTAVQERVELLGAITALLNERRDQIGDAISDSVQPRAKIRAAHCCPRHFSIHTVNH